LSPRRVHLVAMAALCLAWPACAQAALGAEIGLNFTASRFRVDSNFFPPNSMLAAGPECLVELINGRYSVYRKSDGALIQTSSLNEFWEAGGGGYSGQYAFDPHVLYDPLSGRWFASSADGNMASNPTGESHFLLAVSRSGDPAQGWTTFRIDADSNHAQWADFPMLGVNRDGVFLTANMYAIGDGNFPSTGRTVLVLPKADLLSASPNVAGATRIEYAPIAPSCQPVVDLDGGDAPPAFWTSNFMVGRIRRYNLDGNVRAPAISAGATVQTASFTDPPDAAQPGPKRDIDTYDRRLSSNVILREGVVWGVHGAAVNGRAGVHWFKIDEANNVLLQQGFVADGNLAYYYPSIAVNDAGDAVIAFSGSSEEACMSSFAAVGRTRDGVTTFGEPMLLKAGTASFEVLDYIGRNRGGDYSATVPDPMDANVFWTIQEVVLGDDQWATQITQVIVPEPATMLILAAGAAAALARRRKIGTRKIGTHPIFAI
jgi:hypothetical protein